VLPPWELHSPLWEIIMWDCMVSFDERGAALDSGTQRAGRWITWCESSHTPIQQRTVWSGLQLALSGCGFSWGYWIQG
jgi:hypothetical protein